MPLPVNPLPVIRQIFEMLLIWRLQNLSIVMTYGWLTCCNATVSMLRSCKVSLE